MTGITVGLRISKVFLTDFVIIFLSMAEEI